MSAITSRYARAFAEVMLAKQLDRHSSEQQLEAFAELLVSIPQLRTIWENPSVPAEQKRKVLDAIAMRIGASRMVRNFMAVLIDHHRIAALPEIIRDVQTELNQRLGLTDAEVVTVRPLSDFEKHAVEVRVGEVIGKRLRARYTTNPQLLGGAMVKVGSTVFDGSVRGQLEKMKEQLSEA